MFSSPRYTADYNTIPYAYASAANSPSPQGGYARYYPEYTSSPIPRTYASKGHSRRASHEPSSAYAYASPRASPGYGTVEQTAAGQYYYASPQRNPQYVSDPDRARRRPSTSYRTSGNGRPHVSRGSVPHYTYQQPYDSSEEDVARNFAYAAQEATAAANRQSYRHADHQRVREPQVPAYADAEPSPVRRSRARRSSHTPRPTSSPKATKSSSKQQGPAASPSKRAPAAAAAAESPPQATEGDRIREEIPAGYSLKNWDPTETPILLLGSVFDANSLGKWIYDWTVFHHGAATPMSEIAGELWLLLIQLAGKIKRAEECLGRVRKRSNRQMLEDFLESGERLWERFHRLLKACEQFMWKAAKRDSPKSGKATISMGQSSGCEFVDSMFGRDRELEKTEKLMTGMRLWSMRFDANCDEILRKPSA